MIAPALTVSDLEVTSPTGRVLVRADSLAVAPGERVAIRGPSGAGKSTLLFALAGLIAASRGSIHWGDTDLAQATEAQRTAFRGATFGIVFQDDLLFEELSAAENAAMAALYAPRAARAGIRGRAREVLGALGLADRPGRAESYSGGERQRISMARALAGDPPVVLADEPTASLDRANADRLIADLFGAARGRTLVVVSHDPALIEAADRVVTVTDGVLHG